MASNEPKMRCIVGTLVANMLTECEDDFTFNVTYVANRTIDDLCNIAARGKRKFTASELRVAYNDLERVAEEELNSGSTLNGEGRRMKIVGTEANTVYTIIV